MQSRDLLCARVFSVSKMALGREKTLAHSRSYQEMVYCPVSNSSSQKPFVVHDTEGFEPRRADDECDYRKIVGVANMCVFNKYIGRAIFWSCKKNSHAHIRFVYASRDLTVVTSQKAIYAARD